MLCDAWLYPNNFATPLLSAMLKYICFYFLGLMIITYRLVFIGAHTNAKVPGMLEGCRPIRPDPDII